MLALFSSIIIAIIAVKGCDDDILLTPRLLVGDRSELLSNLADGSYNSYWAGDKAGDENVYFYFESEVQVKWILLQRYSNYATWFKVYDAGGTRFAYEHFGDSNEYYNTVTVRFNDVYTDKLRFHFYHGSTVRMSRVEVYGCYNTSTPTLSPTTPVPTDVPTLFPTISPTLAPLTAIPSEIPTALPTTAPSVSPSIANLSPHPSTVPSSSPTQLPSVQSVIPSPSPTLSPTLMISTNHPSVGPSQSPTLEPTVAVQSPFPSISPTSSPTEPPTVAAAASGRFQITLGAIEFLLIVIFCMCAILLIVLLRYRKAVLVNEVLNNAAAKANHIENHSYNLGDYMKQTRTLHNGGDEVKQPGTARNDVDDRVMPKNKTRNTVGEDGRQEAKDHHVDIRFALDKVRSDNGEVFNRGGDLEMGPQDSAL